MDWKALVKEIKSWDEDDLVPLTKPDMEKIDALVRAAERAYEEADRDFIPSMVSLKEALKAIGIKNE